MSTKEIENILQLVNAAKAAGRKDIATVAFAAGLHRIYEEDVTAIFEIETDNGRIFPDDVYDDILVVTVGEAAATFPLTGLRWEWAVATASRAGVIARQQHNSVPTKQTEAHLEKRFFQLCRRADEPLTVLAFYMIEDPGERNGVLALVNKLAV